MKPLKTYRLLSLARLMSEPMYLGIKQIIDARDEAQADLAAARALLEIARDALTYFQVTAICQADTDTATEALDAINAALAGKGAT